jgi:dynein heavy chain 1
LNIGITKLKNTERSVAELGEKLKLYSKQLFDKQNEVNIKMSSLTLESTKVSERQKIAEKTKIILEEQTKNIASRRTVAEKDLAGAEPALLAAQESVKGVTN